MVVGRSRSTGVRRSVTGSPLPLLLVNQTIGPLFAAVVSSARQRENVVLFHGLAYRRTPASARLLTWFGYSLQLASHLLLHGRRYRRLMVVSNPPWRCWRPGAPALCLTPHDSPPAAGAAKTPPPLLRCVFDLMVSIWHQANRVVFARPSACSPSAKPWPLFDPFRSEELALKVFVIPPGLTPPSCDRSTIHQHASSHDGRLLVTYSGNLGLTHHRTPSEATADNDNVQVLLIGTGPKARLWSSWPTSFILFPNPCFNCYCPSAALLPIWQWLP